MYSDLLEKRLDDFLGSTDYDKAEDALYTIVRAAFIAGWKAAGGEMPPPGKVLPMRRSTKKDNMDAPPL